MDLDAIPLLMYGIQVGTAVIDENGVIELAVDSPCQIGIEIAAQLAAGEFDSLTIMPTGVPVTPVPAPVEASDE